MAAASHARLSHVLDELAIAYYDSVIEHGSDPHTPLEWQSILLEEVGELANYLTKRYVAPLPTGNTFILLDNPIHQERELRHAGAVVIAWLLQLDAEEAD